jgi:signal transduction histidine kinase
LHTHTEFDAGGAPALISGAFKDVTELVRAQREADQLGQRLLSLQEEERRRIADELQESTAQHLVAANLALTNLRKSAPHWGGIIDDVQTWVRAATLEIRTFAYLLRPPRLDDEGLWMVLNSYVPGFAHRTGRAANVRINPLIDSLPLADQRVLLGVVQEHLVHVHRQGKAAQVTVDVRCIAGVAHLLLRDDGGSAGRLNVEQLRPSVTGLAARIRHAGGRVEARGSLVHIALPLQRSDAAAQAFAG